MNDPKFGWHIIWITPLALLFCGASAVADKHRELKHKRHMKRILKDNPDINELSTLSGITK